jgi:hypothetical protein
MRGTRYWPSLIASGSPSNCAHSPQEIRPHRQRYVDRKIRLRVSFEEKTNKGHHFFAETILIGIGASSQLPVAEQLLELIDDDQKVDASPRIALLVDIRHTESGYPQRRVNDFFKRW